MSHCATLFIQVKKKKRNLTEIKSLSFKRDLTNWIKDTLSGWLLDKENESPQHISPHRCIPLDIRSYSHEKNTPFFFLDHIIWAYNLGLQKAGRKAYAVTYHPQQRVILSIFGSVSQDNHCPAGPVPLHLAWQTHKGSHLKSRLTAHI